MIFPPVPILVQPDIPFRCYAHLKKKRFLQPKKKIFGPFSDFNLKLLWYVCFPMDFFVTYQKICVFLRPAFLTSWKIEAIFKDLRASEESVFLTGRYKNLKSFFEISTIQECLNGFLSSARQNVPEIL
mgnify:CR=1 FL=1